MSGAALALLLASAAAGLPTQSISNSGAPAGRVLSSDEARRLVLEETLAGLAQRVQTDGSLSVEDARLKAPVAITALGSLALMAGGNQPGRGPQQRSLRQMLGWLLERTDPQSGVLRHESDLISRMHGQGFAVLALSQAWCVSPESELGRRLEAALHASTHCILATQGLEGGWWYGFEKSVMHEGSLTIGCLAALRGAQGAGLRIEVEPIRRAVRYVERSQKPDGSFRYSLGDEHSSVALTAAALATLQAAGEYERASVQRGLDWLLLELARREAEGLRSAEAQDPADGLHVSCPYYERFYLALCLWQASERQLFEQWYPRECERVLRERNRAGLWEDARYGSSYAVAMNSLFLALPESLLPIFQR